MPNNYEFYKEIKDLSRRWSRSARDRVEKYFFNLWFGKTKITGLDEDIEEQQEYYIKLKMWREGKIAASKVKGLDVLAFYPYADAEIGLYGFPEKITPVNERKAAGVIIPEKELTVNKDCVVIFAQPNRKPISAYVKQMAERIADVETAIDLNLIHNRMPFVIPVDETNSKQLDDYVTRIINGDPVVKVGATDVDNFKILNTGAPYLVDRLRAYQVALINDVLTYLGIDNSGGMKSAQLTVDEVNANNDQINESFSSILDTMQKGFKRLNKVLGRSVSIISTTSAVDSAHDREVKGEKPKEDAENEKTV